MRNALRTPLLAGSLALSVAGSLTAQTTATERTAAGTVLQAIDSIQQKLGPEKLAERLTRAKDAERNRVLARYTQAVQQWHESLMALERPTQGGMRP